MTEKAQKNSPKSAAHPLQALRAIMKQYSIQGYLVPHADEYQGEYLPPAAERLHWLTGFSGSAGAAVVLQNKAVVMSDGRYTLQLKNQVDPALFETADLFDPGPARWIVDHAGRGAVIGYDPRLYTEAQIGAIENILKPAGITLSAIEDNLIDAVWHNRPPPPASIVQAFSEAIAGRPAADKLDEVAGIIKSEGGYAAIISLPDSIAWLLNIRGSDVPHNPLALSYAVVHANGDMDWFIDPARVPSTVAAKLGNRVRLVPPVDLDTSLDALARAASAPLFVDRASVPVWFRQKLEGAGATVSHMPDPCIGLKAIKNASEQRAIRNAHERDGVAMVRFMAWLDREGVSGKLSELDIEQKLLDFRRADPAFRDTSFDTIAGWGPNGAIIHYRATPQSSRMIQPPGLLLLDSGAQYEDGTTDITRTIAVGSPTDEMKQRNTMVLKGHVALSALTFPQGTTGADIEIVARRALWDAGLDYAHGTGHGVGCYLSVHEPGAGISGRSNMALKPGMLISNEPGYYKEGAYGIRIENLILVREHGTMESGKARYGFETVTLAPYDRRLIVPEMLDDQELAWLNDYHERVFKTLSPYLGADEKAWLKTACTPLKKNLNPAARPASPSPRV